LVITPFVTSKSYSKGPEPSEPEADFIIETTPIEDTVGEYIISGDILDAGVYSHNSPWYVDDDGVSWVRHRFFRRGFEDSNYFEAYLPARPERGVEYVTLLTAGPNGYSDDIGIYFGDFAVATVTGKMVNVSVKVSKGWDHKQFKTAHIWAPEYTIDGYFLP
jgi:hypothetical protein